MFGFGKKENRKQFNGTVDTKMNIEYQIQTKDNERFPGILAYLEYLDIAWKAKMNDDEAAMYMATLYYCGLIKNGYTDEAEPLGKRVQNIADFCVPKGMISEERWSKFSGAIASAKYEPADA